MLRPHAVSPRTEPVAAAEFIRRIGVAIAAAHPDLRLATRGPLALEITPACGVGFVQSFERDYGLCAADPALLDDLVRLNVANVGHRAVLAAESSSVERILPVLRPLATLVRSDVLFRPLGRTLARAHTLAFAAQQTYLTGDLTGRIGLAGQTLARKAEDNFARRLDEVTVEQAARGVWLASSSSIEASAALLSPSFWTLPDFAGLAAPGAIAPGRHTLLVFDRTEAETSAVGLAVEIMQSGDWPLSSEIIDPRTQTAAALPMRRAG